MERAELTATQSELTDCCLLHPTASPPGWGEGGEENKADIGQ